MQGYTSNRNQVKYYQLTSTGLSLRATSYYTKMITKQQEVEYLSCTIGNYTGSNRAEHLDAVSHDVITDYLMKARHTPRRLWELVSRLLQDSPEAFLLLDDSVQDQRYSRFIELVKLQYSGAEHGLVRGIGVVNLVFSQG